MFVPIDQIEMMMLVPIVGTDDVLFLTVPIVGLLGDDEFLFY